MNGLRKVIEEVGSRSPSDVIRVKKSVDPHLEATAIIARLEKEHQFPILVFERMKGSEFPAVCNVMAERRRIAWSLGVEEAELLETVAAREGQRIAPRRVEDGPVREVILKGKDIDVRRLPILTHNDRDDAPYITSGIAVSRDAASGKVDLGLFRNRLIDERHIGLYYSWGKQIQFLHRRAEEKGEPLPVAIVLGAHPALYLASQGLASVAAGDDEYEIASGLLGEPVELVRCETIDLEVPADAEIVLEGELLPNRREKEGPFGEFTGYYGQIVERPVMRLSAITHRRGAYYQTIASGLAEHVLLALPAREAALLRELRKVVPTVRSVHFPTEAAGLAIYISMEKVNEGDAKNVLLFILGRDTILKMAVVVDDDVDIRNSREVNWAIATRVHGERDILLAPGARGTRLDPTAQDITRLSRDGALVTKIGIDATKPIGYGYEWPERLTNRLADQIDLDAILPSPEKTLLASEKP
ncbi:MAG: UbiD family decarboxylase [Candidatus Tectomicrobia bacterium]|nr:UbiD family decarboxylase [Candidatus Tectomicrobia bacterium]